MFTPPPPDNKKLLEIWTQWEAGGQNPGRVIADLKIAGLKDLLESLVNPSESGD